MTSQAPVPDVTIHHLNASRSERIFWVCEELNIPYEVKVYHRNPVRAPPELKQIHPLGKAPVITDHGKVYAETGAIVDYLLHTYSRPSDTSNAAGTSPAFSYEDSYWSHFSEGSLMLILQMTLVFDTVAERSPWFVKPIIGGAVNTVKSTYLYPETQNMLDFMETKLAESPSGWFSQKPEPGAGDFMLAFPLRLVLSTDRTGSVTKGPNVHAWWEKVKARPAYQKAMKRLEDEEAKSEAARPLKSKM